jgi:hypothetical protein
MQVLWRCVDNKVRYATRDLLSLYQSTSTGMRKIIKPIFCFL